MSKPLLAWATQAKHDLGKYIAFQSRWLPPTATNQDWHQALRSDLLETRKGPKGTEGAVEIWEALSVNFTKLSGDSDLQAVHVAMARIKVQLSGLKAGALADEALQALAEDAKAVASHLSALHKRLREA